MAAEGQPAARTKPGPMLRVFRAWRAIAPEQRVSALAALSLWITMFLPWYSETGVAVSKNSQAVSVTLNAWGAFSFVELAVLVISVAVLALLFARGERRAFHLPGGDGTVILLAGAWAALLIFYRMLDKQGTVGSKTALLSSGIEWGIFLALFAAIWLAWTGLRIRRSHRAEPTLADDPTVHLQTRTLARRERDVPATVRAARPGDPPRDDDLEREHRGVTREDAEQLSFDLPHELRNE